MKFFKIACVMTLIVVLDGDDSPTVRWRCFKDFLQGGDRPAQEIFMKRGEKLHLDVETKHQLEFTLNGGYLDQSRYGFGCNMTIGKCSVQFVHRYQPYSYNDVFELSGNEGSASLTYRIKERDPPSNCTREQRQRIEGNNPNIICLTDTRGNARGNCIMGKTGANCETDDYRLKKRDTPVLREISCPRFLGAPDVVDGSNPTASKAKTADHVLATSEETTETLWHLILRVADAFKYYLLIAAVLTGCSIGWLTIFRKSDYMPPVAIV